MAMKRNVKHFATQDDRDRFYKEGKYAQPRRRLTRTDMHQLLAFTAGLAVASSMPSSLREEPFPPQRRFIR